MRTLAIGGLCALTVLLSACGAAPPPAVGPSAKADPPAACARLSPGKGAARLGNARQGSTLALASSGDTTFAYIADEDARAILTFDVDAGKEVGRTPLAGVPSQLAVLGDGRVAVTLRDKNRVAIFEPVSDDPSAQLEARCSVPVAVEPVGLAVTPDEQTILVTSAWGHKVTALDTQRGEARFEVDVPREPRAVLVDDDGERAFVAHVVGATLSVIDLSSPKHDVRAVDLRVKHIGGPREAKIRGGCQGFALAKSVEAPKAENAAPPPGEKPLPPLIPGPAPVKKAPVATPAPKGRVFAPMVTVDPGEPTVRSSGYGSPAFSVAAEVPMVSVIDAGAERTLTRALFTDNEPHDGECLLPRAAAVSPDGDALYVTCFGTDVLMELDARSLDPARVELRRWNVPAGPSGIAVDPARRRAVVFSQFVRKVSVIPLAPGNKLTAHASAYALAPVPDADTSLAMGRVLFHRTDEARISSDGRACASCHPDGREDALTWSTPDGPRQTIMLAGRVQGSAPFGWLGAHASVDVHLRHTFQRLGGRGFDAGSSEVAALIKYVERMPAPVFDGAAEDASHQALAERGRALFFEEKQGCATCHTGGRGTDGTVHNVGSALSVDRGAPFDTPSLKFIGGTAPYFHDGRYSTLDDLLGASDDKMGHTFHLSKRDVSALKAYMETL